MIVAGIDVGSVSTKVALAVDEKIYKVVIPTGWSPRQAGEDVLAAALRQAGIDGKADFINKRKGQLAVMPMSRNDRLGFA